MLPLSYHYYAFVCKRIHYRHQCTVLHLSHTYFASTSLSICRTSIAKAMILFLVDRNVEKSFRFPAQGLSISSQEKCSCLLCRLDPIPYSSSWQNDVRLKCRWLTKHFENYKWYIDVMHLPYYSTNVNIHLWLFNIFDIEMVIPCEWDTTGNYGKEKLVPSVYACDDILFC